MSRTVVIAGAGPTLGAATAREFAAAGWSVGLLARSAERLTSLADTIDGETVTVATDVTDPDAVVAAVAEVRSSLGRIEAVVHNPNVRSAGSVDETEPAAFERVWRVRAFGGFCLVRAALPDLRETNGTVLFSGTTYATDAPGRTVDWASGAAATRGLARSLADDLAADGVQVTYVAIGATLAGADEAAGRHVVPASEVAETYREVADNETVAATEITLRPRE